MGRRHGPPYEIVEVIVYDMHDADFEELEPFGTTGDDFFGLEGSIFLANQAMSWSKPLVSCRCRPTKSNPQ